MGRKNFYAVKAGHKTGIFGSWSEAGPLVKGYGGALHRAFERREDAVAWMSGTDATSNSEPASDGGSDQKGKKRMMSPNVQDESGWDVVYSDGACKGNGQARATAGVGVWWGENDPRNIAERCPGDQTNNRAELIAILRVLETTPLSKKPLLIKTDSQYSINCFKLWIPKWIRNGFRNSNNEPVKNAAIIRYLSAQLDARARRGQKVRLQYVKGHSGDTGNDGADRQANLGALKPPENEQNWAQLEAELKQRLEVELGGRDQAKPVPLEIGDEQDNIALPDLGESPTKIRKIVSVTDKPNSKAAVEPLKPSSHSAPQVPLSPVPPSASTSVSEISAKDLALYADGLLDDIDLLAELSD